MLIVTSIHPIFQYVIIVHYIVIMLSKIDSDSINPDGVNDAYFQQSLKALPVCAYTCAPDGLITFYNDAAAVLWGRSPAINDSADRFCGSFKLYSPGGKIIKHEDCWMARAIKENKSFINEKIVIEQPSGRRLTVVANANPIHNEKGEVIGGVNIILDITEKSQAEEELKHLASHDHLTGLYNHYEMKLRLSDEIERASRYNHKLSVFMLDIDRFKDVNDTYGHQTGDSVLKAFAEILESSIRNTDFAARYGGEEFVIILPETKLPKAEELAERLRKQIADYPFQVKIDKKLNLTTSIGVATFPNHVQTAQELLEAADSAMYAAKEAGRNNVRVPG